MSPAAKKALGTILSAAALAGVNFLAPAYREAALAVFAFTMAALHIPRPGDVSEKDHKARVSDAVTEALSDIEVH